MKNSRLHFYDYADHTYNLLDDVLAGLSKPAKELHPKLFYDAYGSQLFDSICELPEYYITRIENDIMQHAASDIANCIERDCLLIELGSGNCRKVRHLLPHLPQLNYMPVDISKEQLLQCSYTLLNEFPHLQIHAMCLDYSRAIIIPDAVANLRRVAYFPGSSISNFSDDDIYFFLKKIAALVQPNGGFIISVDLKKDVNVLNAAYNDAQGITAAFNLNILQRINRELQANFVIDNFHHRAFYNEDQHRIEMHLISNAQQDVTIKDYHFQFSLEESIHTENSYKFSVTEFQNLAQAVGFKTNKLWLDENQFFSIHYFGL